MINERFISDAHSLIDDFASEETKELFELDDILYDISMKVFNYRTNKEWTQKELANLLNISQAMVSKLESGTYNPTIEQLWKISKKLKWSFEVVLKDSRGLNTRDNYVDEIKMWDNDVSKTQDSKLLMAV